MGHTWERQGSREVPCAQPNVSCKRCVTWHRARAREKGASSKVCTLNQERAADGRTKGTTGARRPPRRAKPRMGGKRVLLRRGGLPETIYLLDDWWGCMQHIAHTTGKWLIGAAAAAGRSKCIIRGRRHRQLSHNANSCQLSTRLMPTWLPLSSHLPAGCTTWH